MRTIRTVAAAAALVLTATACGSANPDAGGTTPEAPGTDGPQGSGDGDTSLVLGMSLAPSQWDLAEAPTGFQQMYYQPVFDTLLLLSEDGEVLPNLAAAWDYDEARTSLALELRSDVTFSDGAPFDAAAVAANLLHTKAGSGGAASELAEIDDVEATGPTTVTVTLSAPDPSLLRALSHVPGMMASPDALTAPDGPVGSGPYLLDPRSTTEGQEHAYIRNQDYWNAEAYPYDEIVLRFLSDATARTNALLAGEIHGTTLGVNEMQAAEDAGLRITTFTGGIEGVYIWDRGGTIEPALGDVRVRQALNHAFDRQAIIESTSGGLGTVTAQLFNDDSEAYDPALDDRYPYDPAMARALLAEAGYPDGFEITVPDFSVIFPEKQAAMNQQLEDIGITVHLENLPRDQLFAAILSGQYAMSWFKLDAFAPWDTVKLQLDSKALWNPFQYEDAAVTALISDIQSAPAGEQAALFQELNTVIVEEAWNVPWNNIEQLYVTSADVTVAPDAYRAFPSLRNFAPTG